MPHGKAPTTGNLHTDKHDPTFSVLKKAGRFSAESSAKSTRFSLKTENKKHGIVNFTTQSTPVHGKRRSQVRLQYDRGGQQDEKSSHHRATQHGQHFGIKDEHDIFALEGHPRFAAASVVYVYLIPAVVTRLEPLLRAAVADGKRVLIFCTHLGNRIGDLRPTRSAMGGMLALFESSSLS